MEIPAPVNLDKLKNILGNAKKVMKATDEKFSQGKPSSHVNESSYNQHTPIYSEMDEREPIYENNVQQSAPVNVRDYTEEDILNSKMPDNIKQIMLTKPIPKLSYGSVTSAFGLEGLEELIEKPVRKPVPQNQFKSPGVPIRESAGGGVPFGGSMEQMVTISVSQLNEMIDNRVNKLLAEMFTKTVSEQTIKKTINTLIKEGKINTKK